MGEIAADIAAYIDAVDHMLEAEMVGEVLPLVDGVTAIQYAAPILQPAPREFSFHTEFLSHGREPGTVVDTIRHHLGSEAVDHILTVFDPDPAAAIAAYQALGYVHAWTSTLMGADVAAIGKGTVANDAITVRRVTALDDLEAGDLLEAFSPSPRRLLDDPAFNGFIADLGGTVIAKGRLITTAGGIGHVCRILTESVSRHQGACSAILNAIHDHARAIGLSRCVLMPAKNTRAFHLFEKYGYRDVVPIIVLVPRD